MKIKYTFPIITLLMLWLTSCTNTQKVHLQGELKGLTSQDKEIIIRNTGNKRVIPLEQGHFDSEWEIGEPGLFDFFIHKNAKFSLYLKPGYDLHITADAQDLLNTLHFEGKGSETNNFIVQSNRKYRDFLKNRMALVKMDKAQFDEKIKTFKKDMDELLATPGVDEYMINKIKKSLQNTYRNLNAQFRDAHRKTYTLSPGEESPKFFDLENYAGGTVSMDDLKGKFLYIDVWATWCGPCKREIPHMKKLVEEYAGKNIQFISISSDRITAHSNWKKMVEDKDMKGLQLFMGKDKSFAREYNIRSIPRFIFIDPEGLIVNANAPRPSQHAQVTKMFEEAGVK